MKTPQLFTLVAFLACTLTQSVQDGRGERSIMNINLLEVRKVNRPSSSDSQEHNVKIVLSEHDSIPTLDEWILKIVRGSSTDIYSVQAQDPYQTEVEFEADITDATYIYIEGKTSSGTLLANGFTKLNASFLSSRVARVGTKYTESVSSLRVWRGDLDKVVVGSNSCTNVGTPCYYISTTLPSNVSRCVPTDDKKVQQCDDFISHFQEFNQSPRLNIDESGMMTVYITLGTKPTTMEAVVFDPQDPNTRFSPNTFECEIQVVQDGETHCQQQLKNTGDRQEFKVLLVSLDKDGFVLGSKMESYGGDSGPSGRNSTGVIVGSVVGGVILVALLAGAAVYIIKKKKKGGSRDVSSSQGASSSRYDAVTSP